MSSIAQCGQCGKHFSEAYNLKRHNRRVHDGQKDYECKSWGKSFFEEYNLTRHICRNHEDVIDVVHILLKQDLRKDTSAKLLKQQKTTKLAIQFLRKKIQ